MARRAKRGGPKKTEQARRRAELLPIIRELFALNDYACAKELNERGVPAMNGGRWKDTQVARIRQQLALGKERNANVRLFKEIRDDLVRHFGRAPGPPTDDHVIELTAWAAYAVCKFNRLYGPFPIGQIPTMPAADVREFQRRRAVLAGAIELCRIASDNFETGALPSRASAILATATDIAAELSAAMRPAIAGDTDTAGTA